jgi:hypothetical protein
LRDLISLTKREETGIYVLDSALCTPVTLRREIDDVFRIRRALGVEDEHTPELHLFALARGSIRLKIFWKDILELKRESTSHYSNAVNRINQCLNLFAKDVTSLVLDHVGL